MAQLDIPAQPDIPLMAQSGTVFLQQLALCLNLPAVNGSIAILVYLNSPADQIAGLTNHIIGLIGQVAGLTDEMRAKSVSSSS
jgi:hypothetical protein